VARDREERREPRRQHAAEPRARRDGGEITAEAR
jgi:hypothetical protein